MVAMPDDSELLRQVLAGDAKAFRLLAERHAGVALAVARAVLKDDGEAEDVVQDVLVKLWHSADGIDVGEHGLSPWVRRVARNQAIDRLRRASKLHVTDDVPEAPVAADQLRVLEDDERRQVVDNALDELPDRQAMAIRLFHHEGLSILEIAQSMDVSDEAVESLLARGRRGLKKKLAGTWRGLIGAGAQDA